MVPGVAPSAAVFRVATGVRSPAAAPSRGNIGAHVEGYAAVIMAQQENQPGDPVGQRAGVQDLREQPAERAAA